MPKNVELLDNTNDMLYPKTKAEQVIVTSTKNLDVKLTDIDAKIKDVTDEVVNARPDKKGVAHPTLKARLDAMEDATTTVNNTVNSVKQEIEQARGGQANLNDRLNAMTNATTKAQQTATTANNTANNVKTEVEQARGGQANLKTRLDSMVSATTKAQQTATTANNTANSVKQEIDNAKTPNATLKEKIDGIDNKFGRYLPLTGGTLTGDLEVNGNLTTGGNQVWHEGNFDPSTKRDNTHPGLGQWHQGTPIVQSDGVMDIGSIIDFHANHNGQTDYDVRVKSVGGERLELTGSLVSGINNGFSIGAQGARFSYAEFETTFTDRIDTRTGDLKLRGQGGGASVVVESTLIPHNDGGVFNGIPTHRWHVVYSANGLIQTSDERYKADIQDVDDEQFFEMVKGTSVNTYVMLNKRKDIMTLEALEDKENKQDTASPERVQVGIIAQDMAQFDCSKYILVHDEETDIYSVNNYNFTSAVMGALKVEIKKREELEKRVKQLEELVSNLTA